MNNESFWIGGTDMDMEGRWGRFTFNFIKFDFALD